MGANRAHRARYKPSVNDDPGKWAAHLDEEHRSDER